MEFKLGQLVELIDRLRYGKGQHIPAGTRGVVTDVFGDEQIAVHYPGYGEFRHRLDVLTSRVYHARAELEAAAENAPQSQIKGGTRGAEQGEGTNVQNDLKALRDQMGMPPSLVGLSLVELVRYIHQLENTVMDLARIRTQLYQRIEELTNE